MGNQPDIYTLIHKGYRGRLFKMSMTAGTLDYTDQTALDAFDDEVKAMDAYIRLHAWHEERFVHPLLSARMPGGADKLEAEHRVIDHMLDGLSAHYESLKAEDAPVERLQALGLEFYRALNRFIAFFIVHIDEEEEHAQPTLWSLCTDEELFAAWGQIVASQTPEQATESLEMLIPAANQEELANLFAAAREGAPPPVFQSATTIAERLLSVKDWEALKARLGM